MFIINEQRKKSGAQIVIEILYQETDQKNLTSVHNS